MKQVNKKYRNDTATANTLAESNINLVYKVLYDKFKGIAHDTLVSIGMSGLLDAAYMYKQDSKIKFSTFAYSYIYFNILTILKKEKTMESKHLLIGDFSNEYELTKEIKTILNRTIHISDTDFNGLQSLTTLGMYEYVINNDKKVIKDINQSIIGDKI